MRSHSENRLVDKELVHTSTDISNKSMELSFKSFSLEKQDEAEAEAEEGMGFYKSLQELRELRSQLHHAADFCETTFLKGTSKKDVVENTKEYICRAVVTVVDHLGNVSANLDALISQTNAFSDAELRIQCLKQRLLSCEQYADKLALTKMQWRENLPRFHSRYLSTPITLERSSSEKSRPESEVSSKLEDKHVLETHEDLPLFMYTQKPLSSKNMKSTTTTVSDHKNLAIAAVVPVRDGLSVLTKVSNLTFHFQGTPKIGRHRRSLHGSDILWLLRRTKRTL
ncbi:probable protein ABIL5 isoform X2 [Arachis stenosperma]|uniref:probable protein ABIL5 isoform X2 n=1 Tax=Arachis stenosperma TaxID=217475 RepID=UPI0025AB92E2|nr:probable protein ABIL5 isoform X2 [Arachis stenosperma]